MFIVSDIEKIRELAELAQREANRQVDERKRKEESLANSARRMAKNDLRKWVESIERIMRKNQNVFHFSLSYSYSPGFLWGGSYRWYDSSSIRLGPSIDLDEICKSSPETYAAELSSLIGGPFTVTHWYGESFIHHFSIVWGN